MITNMFNIKTTSKLLYDVVEIKENPALPGMGIVSHPFVTNMVTYGNNRELLDLRKEENQKKARDFWFEHIDECENAMQLYILVSSPWKLTWLKYCRHDLSEKDFAELFADAWISQENPNDDANVSRRELISWFKKADKESLMTEEDLAYYNSLPEKVKVYRGVSEGRVEKGLSWTDDKEKAIWFMNRFVPFGKSGYLLEAEVDKENILAYLNTRGEKELVVDVYKIDYRKVEEEGNEKY